jgi:type I restriction enzyme M protein
LARRHDFRPGEWESVAFRLDEIISAHSGEDPFEEALKLLVASLALEANGGETGSFLAHHHEQNAVREVNRLIGLAGEQWRGILEPGAATRLSGPELGRCAAVLNSVRLIADDLVGLDAIFEFMVNKAAKGQKGQFFTPRHVIKEVVEMVRPKPNERLADPACGSGGFLRHALLREPKCSVWGFDQDPRAGRVARVMMAASGQAASRVMRGDSLRRPDRKLFPEPAPVIEELMRAQDPKFRGFDVVLTNPPFAGDVGAEYSDSYELARGKRVERDVLFIERCVELLKPGGRLAIVLPHNKVGGEQWSYARKWLLERVRVVAVLGLGRNTFQPHTSQKACVLLGVKRSRAVAHFRNDQILFFISERDGKDHRGRLLYGADGQTVEHDLSEATPLVRARFDLLEGGV